MATATPAVLVPAYNEARWIGATLEALARQTDLGFRLLVVDNGSSDDTVAVVERFAQTAPFPVELIVEREKGVGFAVDTGARRLIGEGVPWFARTDADCLPRPSWFAAARDAIEGGADLVCGAIKARRDEAGVTGRALFAAQVRLAATFGRFRKANRGPQYLSPYRMHAGKIWPSPPRLTLRRVGCGRGGRGTSRSSRGPGRRRWRSPSRRWAWGARVDLIDPRGGTELVRARLDAARPDFVAADPILRRALTGPGWLRSRLRLPDKTIRPQIVPIGDVRGAPVRHLTVDDAQPAVTVSPPGPPPRRAASYTRSARCPLAWGW